MSDRNLPVRHSPVIPEKVVLDRQMLAQMEPYSQKDVEECLNLGVIAQKAMLERLATQNWDKLSAGDTAHALAFLSRAGGQLLRDASFAKGGPDSRADVAVAAEVQRMVANLSDDELIAAIKRSKTDG